MRPRPIAYSRSIHPPPLTTRCRNAISTSCAATSWYGAERSIASPCCPDPGLAQASVLSLDQCLCGELDHVPGDWLAQVGAQLVHGFARDRVDQPWLTACQLERAIECGRLEHLTGVRRVLGVELGHFLAGEPTHGERLDLDVESEPWSLRAQPALRAPYGRFGFHLRFAPVERTGRSEPPFPIVDLIVADITKPDQRHRPRKALWPLPVTRSKLAQHGDQHVVAERIDLVDEDHQRAGTLSPMRPGPVECDHLEALLARVADACSDGRDCKVPRC
jgi:hypothetical protein